MVEKDYEKKDIAAAPETKAAPAPKSEFPKGWAYAVKRGQHCVWDPEGKQSKFATKAAAVEFANG
tara:strand:- start:83 stop:277 length:195 start_codon:yes stop_codon:yes gene_type:complete